MPVWVVDWMDALGLEAFQDRLWVPESVGLEASEDWEDWEDSEESEDSEGSEGQLDGSLEGSAVVSWGDLDPALVLGPAAVFWADLVEGDSVQENAVASLLRASEVAWVA